MLSARHVVLIRSMQIASRQFFLIELDQRAFAHGLVDEILPLVGCSVAPIDLIGLAKLDALIEPESHAFIYHRLGRRLMDHPGSGGGGGLNLLCHGVRSFYGAFRAFNHTSSR